MSDALVRLLVDQIDFYMNAFLRPRLDGLTDEEFFWEPVADCWSVRKGTDGAWSMDARRPEPDPQPVTTIAWRLGHVAVANLGTRASAFFGDGSVPAEADMFDERHRPAVPRTAGGAIALLESVYQGWRDGIAELDDEWLAALVGPKGPTSPTIRWRPSPCTSAAR